MHVCQSAGLLAGGHPNTISVYAVFDNEEVGSGTKQGAAGTVLLDTLLRVNEALGRSHEIICARWLRALWCRRITLMRCIPTTCLWLTLRTIRI